MTRRLLISFSGGETSAYMCWWILTHLRDQYDEIIIVFANTGQENEQTLEFVDKCDRLLFGPLGHRVTYIEAIQLPRGRRGAFRIVTFETADRSGQVFEEMIRKYGIPNKRFSHCTRDLKLVPIEAYAKSIGWEQYVTAIGIRSDESDRMSATAEARRIIYPLCTVAPRTKPQINFWWSIQPFRLELKGYQGNCKWCWKKSLRKHLTLLQENPEYFEFPLRMEAEYSHIGSEFQKAEREPDYILPPDYRRTFFREGRSTADLLKLYAEQKGQFTPAEDDAIIYDPELDTGGGCGDSESCEVHADELTVDEEAVFAELAQPTWRKLSDVPFGWRAEWAKLRVPVSEQIILAGFDNTPVVGRPHARSWLTLAIAA